MHQPLQTDHMHENDGEKRTRTVVIITLIMMVIEIGTGIVSNSVALLADGLHMGTHAAALGITLYAYYFARTDPNIKNNPEMYKTIYSMLDSNNPENFLKAYKLFVFYQDDLSY